MIRPAAVAAAALGLMLTFATAPGCIVGPGDAVPLPLGDPDVFADDVQPVIEVGCANPSCHGSADRPLETFARFQHRLDPSRVHLDEPLSAGARTLNQVAAAAFLVGYDDPERSPLLTKPLAPTAGGADHAGGVIFGDPWEPGYTALHGWAADALEGQD